MTLRERKLLFVLLGILGVGAVAVGGYVWFLKPLRDYNARLAQQETERDQKHIELNGLMQDKLRLDEARRLSLPSNPDKALTEYAKYLRPLLRDSGLTDVEVHAPPPVAASKAAAQTGKKAGHITLPYHVSAKGTVAALMTALEKLQRTPVMHRVKSVIVDRGDAASKEPTGKLNIQMTLEAMIVHNARADALVSLKPSTALALPTASAPRKYSVVAEKNIFLGASPPPPPLAFKKKETPPPDPEADLDVREHIRLVATNPTNQEAFLRNLIFGGREIRLRSAARSGYEYFTITKDEDRTRPLFKARVLRIDQRDVYFLIGENVYALHIGQTIADAMRRSLTTEDLEGLDLLELVAANGPAKSKAPAPKVPSGSK